jgi:hypothetical protein
MEATKDHISLETAKLLKDSGIESEYYYVHDLWGGLENEIKKGNRPEGGYSWSVYPAYTWQEILWEYPQEFFGEKKWKATYPSGGYCDEAGYLADIMNLLQQKKYKEADQYFRDNCILIK